MAARAPASMTPGRWYVCDAGLDQVASTLHEVTRACRPSLRKRTLGRPSHPSSVCPSFCKKCPPHNNALARESLLPREPDDGFYKTAADPPTSEIVWCSAKDGRAVTHVVRAPVRPATRWMRVVSIASTRVIAGRRVVSRRASIDWPAPGGQEAGDYGQNARMTFSSSITSRGADGYSV
jgi:hypothetical protein